MKPQKHSKVFSPSKSALWLNCYLSTIFSDGNGNETNEQAEFGTECHELGSLQIAKSLDIKDYDEEEKTVEEAINVFKHYSPEMQEIADMYTSFVVSTVEFETSRSKGKPIVLLEQSVDLGFDENSVGTLDFGIISDRDGGQADRARVCLYQEHEELLEVPVRVREYLLRFYFTTYHRGNRFLWLQERREQSEPSQP